MKTAYLVRLRADQKFPGEFVGIFVASGLDELREIVDKCCPVASCQYAVLPSGGIYQTGRAPVVPLPREHEDADLFAGATTSEGWWDLFHDHGVKLTWTALLSPAANDEG